jgi:ABC-type branched-subunit amino acid transport system ATPase component
MGSRSDDVLEINDLSVAFGGLVAVDNVSLQIQQGTVTGVIGPNGAGKSTLFNAISGLVKPNQGTVLVAGRDVTRMPVHKRPRNGIGRSFQETRVFEHMTILGNVMVGAHNFSGEMPWASFAWRRRKREEQQLRQSAADLLRWVGVPEPWDRLAGQLSYGQQKLVDICRLLISQPTMIMLDEPVAGVRHELVEGISDHMREIARNGTSVIVIEHNMRFVWSTCDFVHVMAEGRLLTSGTPEEVSRHEGVISAYLGVPTAEGASG